MVAMKSAGKVGVPDVCSVCPGGVFLGIEVKIGNDRMRPEQEGFKRSLEFVGGYYLVVHNKEDYLQKISTCNALLHNNVSRAMIKP